MTTSMFAGLSSMYRILIASPPRSAGGAGAGRGTSIRSWPQGMTARGSVTVKADPSPWTLDAVSRPAMA